MIAKRLSKPIQVRERKLGREKAAGLAWGDSPPLIEVDPRQTEKERLDTLLHEALHVVFPDLSETHVVGVAKRLTTILWKDGWRRVRGA